MAYVNVLGIPSCIYLHCKTIDMSTIIIAGIIILFIVIISLVLVSINNNRRKKMTIELVGRFNELSKTYNLSFAQKEIMKDFIIGLDELHKRLFVLRKAGNKYDFQIIDLKDVKSCSKKKIYKSINMGTIKKERHENHLDKIALQFDYLDNRNPVQIAFYESSENHLLEIPELEQKAESWAAILTKTLNIKVRSTA
jgi:hypothetical protein